MFLRNEKPDPKQQALDNVLMMLVHKKMTAPREPKRMTPSYPPARNGSTNFEPTFNTKPVSRRGGAANPDIMTALKMYMDHETGTPGTFNPTAQLDPSQVEDRRGANTMDLIRQKIMQTMGGSR